MWEGFYIWKFLIVIDTIFNVIAPIILVMLVGGIYGRLFKPDPKIISTLIIYLFAPFLVLEGITNADVQADELLQIGVFVVIVSLVLAILAGIVGRFIKLERRSIASLILCVVIFNGANYGVPFNTFAFGIEAAEIAVVYYSASAIVTNTLGIYLAAWGTGQSARGAIISVLRVPILYATILGVIFNLSALYIPTASGITPPDHTSIPLTIARVIDVLSDATIPMMLVLIGIQLESLVMPRHKLKSIVIATIGTLIISPLIAALFAALMGMEGLVLQVGIVQFGMPTAVIVSAIVTQFDGDTELTNGTLLLSTLGSILSLSLLVELL